MSLRTLSSDHDRASGIVGHEIWTLTDDCEIWTLIDDHEIWTVTDDREIWIWTSDLENWIAIATGAQKRANWTPSFPVLFRLLCVAY